MTGLIEVRPSRWWIGCRRDDQDRKLLPMLFIVYKLVRRSSTAKLFSPCVEAASDNSAALTEPEAEHIENQHELSDAGS